MAFPKIKLKNILRTVGSLIGVVDKGSKKAQDILDRTNEIKQSIESLKKSNKQRDSGNLTSKDAIIRQIEQFGDLLDDGEDNDSYELPNRYERIAGGLITFLPIIGYLLYVIKTGDFDLSHLLQLLSGLG